MAVMPQGLLAAWYDTRDGNAEIYLRALDAEGRPAGPERRLTSTPEQSYEVSVDALGDDLAVAWYDRAVDATLTARVGVWAGDGTWRWAIDMGRGTRNPVVRAHNRGVFAAWIARAADGSESVRAGWWSASGEPVGGAMTIGAAGKTTWNLNAAVDAEGVAWVVFDAAAGTKAEELFVGRIDRASASVTRITADDGLASKYPDMAIDGGRAALVWYDQRDGNAEVYLAVGALGDLASAADARARRVTVTAGESIGAYVAWNQGRIGVAWSDDTVGQHEVHFQSFDAAGVAMREAIRVTETAEASLIPAIRPWRDGFALAWNEYRPQASADAHASGRSRISTALVH